MMNGLVPYRDLFEQKGPLLYFIHGIAWLISRQSFIGVYCFEIISMTVFLFYSYRIMRLYASRSILVLIPFLGLFSCTTNAFYAGDSAEEFCLSFLTMSIWIILNNLRKGSELTMKNSLLIGVFSGCIFLIKFSLLGMYLGWYSTYLIHCIKNKRIGNLAKTTVCIGIGVILVVIPFTIYFAYNHAVTDWIAVYIGNNVFNYSVVEGNNGFLNNLLQGVYNFIKHNEIIYYLCLTGLILMLFGMKGSDRINTGVMLLSEFVLVYIGGRHLFYYSVIMDAFALFGLIFFYRLFIADLFKKQSNSRCVYSFTISLF